MQEGTILMNRSVPRNRGGGFAFGLSMIFFWLRTENAGKESGMAQFVGYLHAH